MKNLDFDEFVVGRKRRHISKVQLNVCRLACHVFLAAILVFSMASPGSAQSSIDIDAVSSADSTHRSLLNEIPRIIVSARCSTPCNYLKFRLFKNEYTFSIRYAPVEPANADHLSQLVGNLLSASIPSSQFSFVSSSADLTFEFIELYDVSLKESSEFCRINRPVEAGLENSIIKLWFDYESGHVLTKCLTAAMLDIADFPESSFVASAEQPFRGAYENMLLRALANIRAVGKTNLTVEEFHTLLASD